MKEHNGLLFYFGFLKGKMSKAIFLLFCATMVFPLNDGAHTSGDDWLNWAAAAFLSVCALLQVFKYCKNDKDSHNDAPMMEQQDEETPPQQNWNNNNPNYNY